MNVTIKLVHLGGGRIERQPNMATAGRGLNGTLPSVTVSSGKDSCSMMAAVNGNFPCSVPLSIGSLVFSWSISRLLRIDPVGSFLLVSILSKGF